MAQAVSLGSLMAEGVSFAEILDGDGSTGHGGDGGRRLVYQLNHISKGSLGLSEIPDSRSKENDHDNHGDGEP